MRNKRKLTTSLVAVAVALVIVTASFASSARSNSSTTLLRVATTAGVTTWDPIKSFSTEVLYMANMYEPLVYANPPGAKSAFRPGLATNWGRSKDGKTWTFTLRQGVKFHNGEKLTAQAVKDSLDAARKRGGASFIWAPVDSISTPNDYTVVFNLSYAYPMTLVAASENGAWIVCEEALKAAAADSNYFESGKECGTGPYTLKSYESGKQVVLAQNKDYWGGWKSNQFKNVVFQITPEAITQQQALQSGQVDVATSIPVENVAKLAKNPKFKVTRDASSLSYMGFYNTLRPPLDNVLVRRALNYAMPYKDILTVGAGGYGTQSRSAVPKGVFPYSPNTPQYTQNLVKARALLAQAGHKGGGFSLNLTYAAENAAEGRFAPLIKDAFKKIGVTVNIKSLLFNQQWKAAKSDPANAQDMFLLLYWPTYSDAGSDNLWSMFHSSKKPFFNLSYIKSPLYDKLVDGAGELLGTDKKASQAMYEKAMISLQGAAAGFFLYDADAIFVSSKSVKTDGSLNINYPFVQFIYAMQQAG
jgi:peptide/nickel transport system substrate-binding protein